MIYVISGGPSTGKTEVIKELKRRGYNVLLEAARRVAKKEFVGKSVKEIDMKIFQDLIFDLQRKEVSGLKGVVFSDRGLGDTIAYYKINNLKVSKEKLEFAKKFRYSKIFILDFLNFYEKDELRKESKDEQEKIQEEIIKTYKEIGYIPIIVPFMSIKERVDFILKNKRLLKD